MPVIRQNASSCSHTGALSSSPPLPLDGVLAGLYLRVYKEIGVTDNQVCPPP